MSSTTRRAAWAGLFAVSLVLAACGGGGGETDTADEAPAATLAPTTTESTTTTTTLPPILAPLTGLAVDAEVTRPALVVKIDNHPKARPQWG